MAMSIERKASAKQKAKEYLEFSVYTLALTLGVNPEDVSESLEIPVSKEEDPKTHRSFVCLIEQHKSLLKLRD
jgi:hypothetical protein